MDKSALIAALMEGLSARFVEVRTEAEHDLYRHDGGSKALLAAASSIVQLSKLVDDDLEKGRYEVETGQRIKSFIARASQMLMDQARQEAQNKLIAQGRAQGILDLVAIAKKRQLEEESKKDSEQDLHPGPSLKEERLAEETAPVDTKVSSEETTPVKTIAPLRRQNAKRKRTG